jgi:phage-related protein
VAGDGTSFEIDVDVRADSAESAAAAVARLSERLTSAQSAAKQAAEAVKAGQEAYRETETSADRAAKALERINLAAEANQKKLAAAMAAGDESKFWRLAAAANQLATRQAEASAKADAAQLALAAQAASLDSATAAADAAAQAETALATATESARTKAEEHARAVAAEAEAIRSADAAIVASTSNRMAVLMRAANEEAKAIAKEDADIAAATANRMSVLMNAANQEAAAKAKVAEATSRATAAAGGSAKVNEMAEAFGKLGGPLGMAGQRAFALAEGFKKLQASLGSGGVYAAIAVGIFAIAAGVAAVSAAAVTAVVSVTAWAVSLADAGRSQRLLSDGIAGSVAGGKLLNDKLDELAMTLPQSRDELAKMAADLRKSGLEGDALSAALESAAVDAAKVKLGPDFAKQMTSLAKQSERLKMSLSKTFGGLDIDRLLSGMSGLVELFDSSNASGMAMKTVFESMFQPLIDGIGEWLPRARTAFIQFEIMAMKALISIKPFGSTILTVAEVIGGLALIITGALALAIGVVVAGVGAMAVGFGVLVAGVVAFAAAIVGVVARLYELGAVVVGGVIEAFNAVSAWFAGFSLSQVGADIINGLVAGITNAGPNVLKAITGAVTGAIGAAKSLLGIASPSKVFAEIGGYTAEGMAVGVDAGAADVQGSLESMVAPPPVPVGGAATAPAAGGASAGGANLSGAVFNFYGVEGAEDAVSRLLEVIEGFVAQGGKAVPT